MNKITDNDITIRYAEESDAVQLTAWWNDGTVMAHAGFPNGLNTTVAETLNSIKKDNDDSHRFIIEIDSVSVGEMNYRNIGGNTAEIGIKICNAEYQGKGYGSRILKIFIAALFDEMGFNRIILDTNLNNTRAQHVYEKLGFKKIKININSWRDQLGEYQSSVDYELIK